MAKHKKKKVEDDRPSAPPKFAGFKPLAAGLGDLKAKLDAEKKVEDERRAAAGKPPPKAAAPRATPAARAERVTTKEEDELSFHRMMSGVVPLDAKSARVPVGEEADARGAAARIAPAELRKRAQADAKDVLDHLHRLVDEPVRFEVTDDGKRVEGRRMDTPPSLVRELRRGQLPIDGRLDLHGLDAASARERVVEFLRTTRARGERCVLVIHGKGQHSPAGGVLRGEIAAWLSQGRAREHVAAFATAREEDGGEGAVYVALRR